MQYLIEKTLHSSVFTNVSFTRIHRKFKIVSCTQNCVRDTTVFFLQNYRQKIVWTFAPDWDIPLFVQQQAPDGCRVPPSEREHYRIFLYFDQNDGSCSDPDNQLSGLASGPTPGTGGGQGVNNRVAEIGVLAIHILIITIVTLDRWWRLARAFLPS